LGYTALHLAAEMGYADILSTLLDAAPSQHASSSAQHLRVTAQGRTALHLAVTSGVQECVTALLADDAAEMNALDNVRAPLCAVCSVSRGFLELI
jgi:ankyrin repeat protein